MMFGGYEDEGRVEKLGVQTRRIRKEGGLRVAKPSSLIR